MINQLTFTIRSSPTRVGSLDEIVDFEIDSESIWNRMLRLQPDFMANPKANPDGTFVGVPAWGVCGREDAYRFGYHHEYWGHCAGFLPLLACGDCGEPGCGGIWTRVFVGPKRVFWSGLGFSNAGGGFRPVYDTTTFVFDRHDYDATISALVSQIPRGSHR
jgi:hypothetical protein